MANGKRYDGMWSKISALMKLRKKGYSLRECAQRMSTPLAEVEEAYLAGIAKGGHVRERMRVDNEAYLERNKYLVR